MWMQGAVRRKDIQVIKIHTTSNPADVLTMFLGAEETVKHMDNMGLDCRDAAGKTWWESDTQSITTCAAVN